MKAILDDGKALTAGIAGVVLLGVGVHEWLYREHHKYASGPATVILVGAFAGAVVAFVVMFMATAIAAREVEVKHLIELYAEHFEKKFEALDRPN